MSATVCAGAHAALPFSPAVLSPQRSADGGGLIRVLNLLRFAGTDLISNRIPDETTILAFRHLLEKHNLGEQTCSVGEEPAQSAGDADASGQVCGYNLDWDSWFNQ